jgi:hypothetical protein
MNAKLTLSIASAVFAFFAVPAARAENFRSVKECTPGTRVIDGLKRHATIVKNDGATRCTIAVDGGKQETLIFWMLHAEGGSSETNDKLVPGKYECFANGRYTFMDMFITGTNTYQSAGVSGRFHVEPSRKIVFETGSLAKYHAKLLQGPSIGLNTDGGTFYAATCELKKK